MAKNDLAARMREENQNWLNMGLRVGFQRALDYAAIAMRDADVCFPPLGREKIQKIIEGAAEYDATLGKAFLPSVYPEADYCQEMMDRHLQDIFREKFQPFSERYPEIREIDYSGHR